jgi:hypothetical protein
MKALYKTTAIIWTDYDPFGPDCDLHMHDNGLELLAHEVLEQEAHCSRFESERVANPEQDSAWDGTTFFEEVDKMEKEEADGNKTP